jgi:2-iminoacetate synthase ThiH
MMLDNWIPNLQVSWVKEGHRFGQMLLTAGGLLTNAKGAGEN